MARHGKHGELSWSAPRKRWYKKIKNQNGNYAAVFFGPAGKGSGDMVCRRKALAAWAAYKQEQELKRQAKAFNALLLQVQAGAQPIDALGATPFAAAMLQDYGQKGMLLRFEKDGPLFVNPDALDPDKRDPGDDDAWVGDDANDPHHLAHLAPDPAEARRQLMDAERQREAFYAKHAHTAASKKSATVADHIGAWLAAEARRHRANPRDLSATGVIDKEKGIATLKKFAGGRSFGGAQQVDQLLIGYRAHIEQLLADNSYTPNTANDKLKFAKQFITWCWETNLLREQPRQLRKFAKRFFVQKGGKPLELEDVRKLWAAAAPRMRCFVALALNCAFKNGDVTALTGGMLRGDRLTGFREKKNKNIRVPMNYALWPSTLELIAQARDRHGDNERVFVNTRGGRISTGVISNLFKKVAARAGVEASFEQLRDTSVEFIKQALYEGGSDLALKQVFMAHKDSSTAAYYLSDDPAHLKSAKLDELVLGLEKVYDLRLKTPVKKQ